MFQNSELISDIKKNVFFTNVTIPNIQGCFNVLQERKICTSSESSAICHLAHPYGIYSFRITSNKHSITVASNIIHHPTFDNQSLAEIQLHHWKYILDSPFKNQSLSDIISILKH